MNDERENLVSFSKIKEIINGINPQEDMVEFSASVGTYSVPAQSELTLEQAVENVDNIMYEQKQAFHKEDDQNKEEAHE